MTSIRLAFVHEFNDRHGKTRRYFRRPGFKSVSLPGLPGSEEFIAAYQAALAGQAPAPAIGASRTRPGTINAAVVGYFNSMAIRSLAPYTQATYRGAVDGVGTKFGFYELKMSNQFPFFAFAGIVS